MHFDDLFLAQNCSTIQIFAGAYCVVHYRRNSPTTVAVAVLAIVHVLSRPFYSTVLFQTTELSRLDYSTLDQSCLCHKPSWPYMATVAAGSLKDHFSSSSSSVCAILSIGDIFVATQIQICC